MAANNDVKENEITQASAQATLANLKEIRVVTTDGSSKAYGKADFMAVIAAGIKSYFSSIAAGNIAGILTADSGKAGISALADVAQVLGALFYRGAISSPVDFNDYKQMGIWQISHNGDNTNSPNNGNSYKRMILIVIATTASWIQIATDARTPTNNIYYRMTYGEQEWGAWRIFTTAAF